MNHSLLQFNERDRAIGSKRLPLRLRGAKGTLLSERQACARGNARFRDFYLGLRELPKSAGDDPDIPCVSARRLGLWLPGSSHFGPKNATFAAESQFEIFQFVFAARGGLAIAAEQIDGVSVTALSLG
jgi:hypothetical protein